MKTRKLGTQGLEVSAIGLGCMGMSWAYGPGMSQSDADALVARAVDLGITFFDTAEVYGPFANEELVGHALRGLRDKVQIATKFGFKIVPESPRPVGVDSRPENIKAVADASLKRLGVEVITEKDRFVHVSGHPNRDELARMYQMIRPKIAVPVHGELRHMMEHAALAKG